MSVTVFEGIGGSGKTTVINLLKKREKSFTYFHEDRDPAPQSISQEEIDDYFLRRNINVMNSQMFKLEDSSSLVFDRSYISAIAVAYSKSRLSGREYSLVNAINYIRQSSTRQIDNLVVCLCEASKSVARRTERDGFTHPLWSNIDLVRGINTFYLENAPLFSNNVLYLNTGDDEFYSAIGKKVTEKLLDDLAKTIKK